MATENLVYLGIGAGIAARDPYFVLGSNAIQGLGFGVLRARDKDDWERDSLPSANEIFARMSQCEAVMLPLCFKFCPEREVGDLARFVTVFENEMEAFKQLVDPTIDLNNAMQHESRARHSHILPVRLLESGTAKPTDAARMDYPKEITDRIVRFQRERSISKKTEKREAFTDAFDLHCQLQARLVQDLPGISRLKVLLSSTFHDLVLERSEIKHAFELMGYRRLQGGATNFELLMFEDLAETPEGPEDLSRNLVKKATLYLGILKANVGSLRLTRLEYELAKNLNRVRAFLFGDPDAGRHASTDLHGSADASLDDFRKVILEDRIPVRQFSDVKDLRFKIIPLVSWLTRRGVDMAALPPQGRWYVAHP